MSKQTSKYLTKNFHGQCVCARARVCVWCRHEVQAPNYTHVQEEEQKEDGPTCGLMDGAYQLLGLTLSKPEHLMTRVSLGFLYAFLLLHAPLASMILFQQLLIASPRWLISYHALRPLMLLRLQSSTLMRLSNFMVFPKPKCLIGCSLHELFLENFVFFFISKIYRYQKGNTLVHWE